MATLPAVPPILDQDRFIFQQAVSPVTTVNVTFPVFGDGSDLIVMLNNVVMSPTLYAFTSPSGPLTQLPLPITDGVLTFAPPIPLGNIAVIGAWHARQIIQPSAPGISRREFNQTTSTLIAAQREVERALRIAMQFVQTDTSGDGYYNASGDLISNVADAVSPQDAVNLETMNLALADVIATGGSINPVLWILAGDGVTQTFSISGTPLLNTPLGFNVSANGLMLIPATDYTINAAAQTISFTIAPENGSAIQVRMIGYARSVTNISTEAQAIAGTDNSTYMTPLCVNQAAFNYLAIFVGSNPAFTGTPTAPTAAPGTNTNQIATTAFAQAAAASAVPSGAVVDFPCAAAPTGWLALAGQLVSRATYPNLWAFANASGNIVSDATWTGGAGLYDGSFSTGDGATTFRLLDPRGDFIRTFDGGRGVDAGRALGSMQGDAMQTHEHTGQASGGGTAGAGSATGYSVNPAATNTTGNTGRTAAETRPRNIALLTCIKT